MTTVQPATLWMIFWLTLALGACSRPTPPSGVDGSAVWVEGAKTGYWQVCSDVGASGIHCTIWNRIGTMLENDTFLPLDGEPVQNTDLKIRSSGACTGPYQVCLVDGRILLPKSRFQEMKAFIERARR
jgi:hypothetical protein